MLLMAMAVAPGEVAAQQTEATETRGEDATREDSTLEQKVGPLVTKTARLNRLRQTIKLDQKKLAETRKQLVELETFFEKLNASLAKSDSELADKKKQFGTLGEARTSERGTDPEFSGWATDDPVMLGVDKFAEYGVIIKTFVQTQPDKIFQTRRKLLRRIKKRFDEEGIEISVPQRMFLQPKSA